MPARVQQHHNNECRKVPFFHAIFVAIPTALASSIFRGRGTIQDEEGNGQTLMGDSKCNSIGPKQASWMSVGGGYLCRLVAINALMAVRMAGRSLSKDLLLTLTIAWADTGISVRTIQ